MHCQIHLYLKYLSLKKLKGRLLWHVHQLSRCKMSGVKYLALVYCTFPWIRNIKITFCKYAGFAFWQDLGFDRIKMQHRSSNFFIQCKILCNTQIPERNIFEFCCANKILLLKYDFQTDQKLLFYFKDLMHVLRFNTRDKYTISTC